MLQTVDHSQQALAVLGDPRWSAVAERDTKADQTFFYSVKTTGVYCRPSCGSRLPKPENVHFYKTAAEAEKAGFRPCKRCRPTEALADTQNALKISEVCRLMDRSESRLKLRDLAKVAGMSESHFHRMFKTMTGITPKAYAVARQSSRMRDSLGTSESVTEAIYEAGFTSSSRFYGASDKVLGMTPTQFREGGIDTRIRFAVGDCSLGSILVATSARGVCAISIGDDPAALVIELQDQFPKATLMGAETGFEELVAKVIALVEAPGTGLDLPLDIRGTAFQQRVWKALQQLPAGATASYSQIAERIGMPRSARAVARACAANTIAIAIPCHRVVRSDGALSGYRWGVERKGALLQREAHT